MNFFIFTGRIVTVPRLFRYKKNALTQVQIALANDKKGLLSYNIYARAKFKLAHEIFDLYRKGDFVIIEGSTVIKSKKKVMIKGISRNKKFIIIKIHQIHPASIVFK